MILFSFLWQRMKATKAPTEELSLTNRVAVNGGDFPEDMQYVFSSSTARLKKSDVKKFT